MILWRANATALSSLPSLKIGLLSAILLPTAPKEAKAECYLNGFYSAANDRVYSDERAGIST